MKVAMMQPVFMPWQGYFELIYKSDIFIFLDDFQFSIQGFDQRNRLFVNQGQIDWYTIPVQKKISFKASFNQALVNEVVPWRNKMWKRIQHNYSKAPFYNELAGTLESWFFNKTASLAETNISFIILVCEILGLPSTRFLLSSECEAQKESKRSMRVLELIKWCKADTYLSAKGSFDYMLEDGVFPICDVDVLFQDFRPGAYNQMGTLNSFVPYLSVLDALLNVGPVNTLQLINNGTSEWLTWEKMLLINKDIK